MNLSFKQTDMMKHAYGASTKEPGYRTHYCTSLDDKHMVDMVKQGIFKDPVGVGTCGPGYGIFHLTEKGIEIVKGIVAQERQLRKRLRNELTQPQAAEKGEG